jgi:hypothetical protein
VEVRVDELLRRLTVMHHLALEEHMGGAC